MTFQLAIVLITAGILGIIDTRFGFFVLALAGVIHLASGAL